MSGGNTSLGGSYDYFDYLLNWYYNHHDYYGHVFWRDFTWDWKKALETGNYTVDYRILEYPEYYTIPDPRGRMSIFVFMTDLFLSASAYEIVDNVFSGRSPLFVLTAGFGVVSNILSVMVFHRQGIFKDSCTVTLTALSIWDTVVSFFNFFLGVSRPVAILMDYYSSKKIIINVEENEVNLGLNLMIFEHFVSNPIRLLQNMFLFQVIGFITSYLSLERMISVTFPFKVKTLITPRRSCFIISGVVLFSFLIQVPRWINYRLTWIEMDDYNGTFKPFISSPEILPHKLVSILTIINKNFISLLHLATLTACNVIVSIKVNSSQKFRRASGTTAKDVKTFKSQGGGTSIKKAKLAHPDNKESSSRSDDAKTRKELRLIRLMYMMSLTFIIARTPDIAYIIIQTMILYMSSYWFSWGLTIGTDFFLALESVGVYFVILNESTNIFIYYALSQKYRKVFSELFSSRFRRVKGK